MFSGIGLSEIMVVMLLALLVLGPEKLPETARKLGKGMRELRRASNMFTDMFMLEEDPTPAKQNAPASQQPSGSFEPPPYEYKEGDTIARDVQKRLRSRPVLLSKVRYPTDIESVPLNPCRPAPSQDSPCVHVELAPTRGVGL
ncbi:Sec-independent protein translocase subunit TatA/TatB [Bradymonas sediminis]|nr:twin-arginine translocase TatA/TatE family subunit [Bradymonas sediminis]